MPPALAAAVPWVAGAVGVGLLAKGQSDAAASAASAATAQARAMAEARESEAQYRHDAMVTDSNNRLDATKDQDLTMRYGIMKNSQDFQFQVLAWLTNQLETVDAKIQISMKDAEVRIKQIESDERTEYNKIQVEKRELDIREEELNKPTATGTSSMLS